MDLREAVAKKREETLSNTDQLVVEELIELFEMLDSPDKVVTFEGEFHPVGLGSWRGSYEELAIRYEEADDSEGVPDWHKEFTDSPDPTTASDWKQKFEESIGQLVTGYKGGKYQIRENTPVWVASYGSMNGFTGELQGVVGLREEEDRVVIVTEKVRY